MSQHEENPQYLRILEEVTYWKHKEAEHTQRIRELLPDLETVHVTQLEAWEKVFTQSEAAAKQWMEWTLKTKKFNDPYLQSQVQSLAQSSIEQSEEFVRQLEQMKFSSEAIRNHPKVDATITHIQSESQNAVQKVKSLLTHTRLSAHAVMVNYGEVELSSIEKKKSVNSIGIHTLPMLPYRYNALEPYIDQETMEIHHKHHHQHDIDGLNIAEGNLQTAREQNDFAMIAYWEKEFTFHSASHYLHSLFWEVMKPQSSSNPSGAIAKEILETFHDVNRFRQHFSHVAEQVEGSGWAILVWSPLAQRIEILQTEKHQNLAKWDVVPLLPLDVWEHAYYLKYKQNRKAYIEAWWNVVNWDVVNHRLVQAQSMQRTLKKI